MPREDSAILRLSAALARLATTRLPVHVTATMQEFLEAALAASPRPLRALAGRAFHSATAPRLIPYLLRALPDRGLARSLGAMLSNTASPTVLRAGSKINVIPGLAEAEIDGRTLPGQTDADFMAELSAILGPDVELEVVRSAPPLVTEPSHSPMFDTIVEVLGRREPGATVVPYLMPGYTDGKYFSRLGAKWYGFSPVKLPRGMKFGELFHGTDERIPVDGLKWGAEVLGEVVARFCAA
jgi:acetylornithine deacetylase/succinyl-diaminopimelate desuccinylase-like protein